MLFTFYYKIRSFAFLVRSPVKLLFLTFSPVFSTLLSNSCRVTGGWQILRAPEQVLPNPLLRPWSCRRPTGGARLGACAVHLSGATLSVSAGATAPSLLSFCPFFGQNALLGVCVGQILFPFLMFSCGTEKADTPRVPGSGVSFHYHFWPFSSDRFFSSLNFFSFLLIRVITCNVRFTISTILSARFSIVNSVHMVV